MRSRPPASRLAAAPEGQMPMLRNTTRGILGLVFAAGATWLANFVIEKIFGPEESDAQNA